MAFFRVSNGGTFLGTNEYLGWSVPFQASGYWKSSYTDGVEFAVGRFAFAAVIANVEGKTTLVYSDNQGDQGSTPRGAVFGMKSDGTITHLGPTGSYSANTKFIFSISPYDYILVGAGYGYAQVTLKIS